MPPIYVVWFVLSTPQPDARLWAMALLVTLWGARLTFNFARKGGYARGGEDYRWVELRARMSPRAFEVFNLFFIAGFQQLLLLGISLPALEARHGPARSFGVLDALLCMLFLVLLAGETLADEQQWRFQRAKQARGARGEPVAQEFLTTGLFRYAELFEHLDGMFAERRDVGSCIHARTHSEVEAHSRQVDTAATAGPSRRRPCRPHTRA